MHKKKIILLFSNGYRCTRKQKIPTIALQQFDAKNSRIKILIMTALFVIQIKWIKQ